MSLRISALLGPEDSCQRIGARRYRLCFECFQVKFGWHFSGNNPFYVIFEIYLFCFARIRPVDIYSLRHLCQLEVGLRYQSLFWHILVVWKLRQEIWSDDEKNACGYYSQQDRYQKRNGKYMPYGTRQLLQVFFELSVVSVYELHVAVS